MKHKQRFWVMGILLAACGAAVSVGYAQIQSPEYDAPPAEMHPDRWPGPAETKEPAVSAKTETDVLAFLRKHMKYYYDRLMQLKRKDIRAYRRALTYLEGKVRQLQTMPPAVREDHIRSANVQVDILRTAKAYHGAKKDSVRNSLKEKIQKLLAEKFDIEQKVGAYRLKRLGEKLNERKQKLQERQKNRDTILAEELRCWLQPPAGAMSKPTEPKKTPATQPATKPTAARKASPPATQPTEPTSQPTTKPAKKSP